MLSIFFAAIVGLTAFSAADAQGGGPFAPLAGRWSGAGNVELSNGTQESIHCRAAYDVLSARNLQLNIRCASESYNFDLRGSVRSSSGSVSGTWSESTRNAGGTLSGEANGEHIQVVAKGPAFAAMITLTTRGRRQTVTIRSQDSDSTLRGASIHLRRS
ncbi:MAG TPA: hypothetical protein VFX37_10970 [Pseudolabrys sp.]|nr:hypothetical protein [Pseudolabrys sp.]